MLQTAVIKRQLLPSEKKIIRDAMSNLTTSLVFCKEVEEEAYINAIEALHNMYPDVFGSH